ncbi:MAG TPA: NUDIX hydrolase [Rhodothermales bacterium]|nr:NUDIX hydrolase [Rhodothermales bacterium]
MPESWETLGRREVARARVFTLHEVRTRAPHTGEEHDFYVIEAGDWCNVVAITDADELVCVRQYRHGVERTTLEIPGGIIDAGETPEQAAARELLEETGYEAERVVYVGAVDSNPVILTNRTHTCVALGLHPKVAAQALDATEDIEVVLVPLAEMPAHMLAGDFSHALAVAALYLVEVWRGRNQDDEGPGGEDLV